jgi:hypothetical protein
MKEERANKKEDAKTPVAKMNFDNKSRDSARSKQNE